MPHIKMFSVNVLNPLHIENKHNVKISTNVSFCQRLPPMMYEANLY